jgi:hypothetical protein
MNPVPVVVGKNTKNAVGKTREISGVIVFSAIRGDWLTKENIE